MRTDGTIPTADHPLFPVDGRLGRHAVSGMRSGDMDQGCLGGLIGFFMICAMAERLCADTRPAAVFAHYVLRWLFYGTLLLLAMQGGIHPLWVLAGLLAHKLSILLCVMKER